ncbi:uncharacterized protein LOC126095554 [Schistocerca cancellata]|uniref:uncharacterized protein LOC126095554 n=1 Tax=Schistocerca cancellata TaxID=274614 RepID=UPI002118FFF8|nr:uncharacterized protein LOC126095554 [Schistocerca cancellata]
MAAAGGVDAPSSPALPAIIIKNKRKRPRCQRPPEQRGGAALGRDAPAADQWEPPLPPPPQRYRSAAPRDICGRNKKKEKRRSRQGGGEAGPDWPPPYRERRHALPFLGADVLSCGPSSLSRPQCARHLQTETKPRAAIGAAQKMLRRTARSPNCEQARVIMACPAAAELGGPDSSARSLSTWSPGPRGNLPSQRPAAHCTHPSSATASELSSYTSPLKCGCMDSGGELAVGASRSDFSAGARGTARRPRHQRKRREQRLRGMGRYLLVAKGIFLSVGPQGA